MEAKTEQFNFRPLGQAIKKARNDNNWTREQLAGMLGISPRYLVDIENEGQHPSLQVLYMLVTLFDISVDQFLFPKKKIKKDTSRRQLDILLDDMDRSGIAIMTATAKGIKEVETEEQ
jgi:transcriptional regulator with XRE-family HTH domain